MRDDRGARIKATNFHHSTILTTAAGNTLLLETFALHFMTCPDLIGGNPKAILLQPCKEIFSYRDR
jgi:hypothetical protein